MYMDHNFSKQKADQSPAHHEWSGYAGKRQTEKIIRYPHRSVPQKRIAENGKNDGKNNVASRRRANEKLELDKRRPTGTIERQLE